MTVTRRNALSSLLFGSGMLGLRALATGLPASFLLDPRKALADVPACGATRPQYFILSTSGGGDPLGCNGPGSYTDPNLMHPQVWANPVNVTVGGQNHSAAAPWATLPASITQRLCFWNLMTNTPVHPKEPDVLRLMNAIQPVEMFPSLLAKQLAPCLQTLQVQPVAVGGERLSFNGAPLPNIPPKALQATLLDNQDALTKLSTLRDQTVDSIYDLYRGGTAPQKAYIDSLVTSTQQVRGISQTLLANLNSIQNDSVSSQITAAVTLLLMNVTPVVTIHIGFGDDNHQDAGLAHEVSETTKGVQDLIALMSALDTAGLTDKTTVMTLNVFGRTMNKQKLNQNGRDHNAFHQTSLTISSAIKGGVVGGIQAVLQPGGIMDYGCTDISSADLSAAGNNGDVKAIDTLASFAKTVMASVGIASSTIESSIPSGKVLSAALV